MSASLPLPEAYYKTTYLAETPLGRLRLRVGLADAGLVALLRACGVREWAYLTAWNPGGAVLPRAKNERRQNVLVRELATYLVYRGEGVADAGDHAEESVLVIGIELGAAREFGRKHGQVAILVGGADGVPHLVRC